jgi:hypothetical protein
MEDVRKVRDSIQGDDWNKNNNDSTTQDTGCIGEVSLILIMCSIVTILAVVLIFKRKKETS